MRVRQAPCAHAAQVRQSQRVQTIDVDRALAAPELAHVIVARPAVLRHETRPAEQHVGGGMDQLLPLHHTLAMRRIRRAADEPFEDRLVGLLHLQHQRVVKPPSGAGGVMKPETVQHITPVLVQALPVAVIQCVQPLPQHPEIRIVLQLADRHQLRRLRAEPQPLLAAVKIGELRGRMVGFTHRRAQRGVAQRAVALAVHRAFVMVERRLHVEMVVPDVEEVHLRELADMGAVRVHAACDRVAPVLLLDAVRPPADLHGHREPLHVTFPRSRGRLVVVVVVFFVLFFFCVFLF